MIELLAFAAFLAVSAVAAERGHAAVGIVGDEMRRRRQEQKAAVRAGQLRAVRSRMAQIEAELGSGRPLLPAVEDEYDLLVLEERVLVADEV